MAETNVVTGVKMKGIHISFNLLLIGLFVLIWMGGYLLGGLSPLNTVLWHALMVIILVAVAYISLYPLNPAIMIIRTYLQEIDAVASSGEDSEYEGFASSGIVPVFPPGLAHAYTLPLTTLVVPFPKIEAVTDDDRSDPNNPVPSVQVRLSVGLEIRINPSLQPMRKFLRVLPILNPSSKDLTVEHELEFFDFVNQQSGEIVYKKQWCPCIVKILQDKLGQAVGEAVSRAVGKLLWYDVVKDKERLENLIKLQFDNTILTESGIMIVKSKKVLVPDKEDSKKLVKIQVNKLIMGNATTFLDFTLDAATLANPDTLIALSAEQTAIFEARAKKAQARGDAEYVKLVAIQASTPGGRAALAAETLKHLPPGTRLLAGTNLLSATAASLLDQNEQSDTSIPREKK